MSLFFGGLSHFSKKEGKASMLIGDIDITRLMMHVQHVEKDKKRDKKSITIRAKTSRNKSKQQKGNGNQSTFQKKQKIPSTAHAPRNKGKYNSKNP